MKVTPARLFTRRAVNLSTFLRMPRERVFRLPLIGRFDCLLGVFSGALSLAKTLSLSTTNRLRREMPPKFRSPTAARLYRKLVQGPINSIAGRASVHGLYLAIV